jgi:hypothetical protein
MTQTQSLDALEAIKEKQQAATARARRMLTGTVLRGLPDRDPSAQARRLAQPLGGL